MSQLIGRSFGTPMGDLPRLMPGSTIQLQRNVSGTWTNVTGATATTQSDGSYTLTTSEGAAGTYSYRTIYGGNATYSNAISAPVTVTVSSVSTALTITAVTPAPNATNVAVTADVIVTFNEGVQPGPAYGNVTLTRGTARVSTTTVLTGASLTLTPKGTLAYATTYTLTVPRTAVENGTTTLTNNFTSHFTTAKARTALTLNASATATAGKDFAVTGRLTLNGTATSIGNQTITLLKYNATGGNYDISVGTVVTDRTGTDGALWEKFYLSSSWSQ